MFFSDPWTTILAVLVAVVTWLVFVYHQQVKGRSKNAVEPFPWPLIGMTWQVIKNKHRYLDQVGMKHVLFVMKAY